MRTEEEPQRTQDQASEDSAIIRWSESMERAQSGQEIRIMLLDWKSQAALQAALNLLRQVRCQGRVLRVLRRDLGNCPVDLV